MSDCSECSFQPLLFGGDINVYSVARAFHEAYGVKSIAYGKYTSFPCSYSDIIDYRPCEQNEDEATFLRKVKQVAAECAGKDIILIGCGDSYVKLAAHLRDQFPSNVVCNYISGEMVDRLTDKEQFYKLCDQYGVDHPDTFVYDGSMGHDFELPWGAPYVAKPADGVAYWATGHNELKKVYICQTWEELLAALDEVYAAGYPGKMILQEFIPGDDTYMRVLTNYSDTKGKVKLCVWVMCCWRSTPHTASATTPSSLPSTTRPSAIRSGPCWRTSTMWASPTSTSNTTAGTASTRPLNSTSVRAAATTMSPAPATTSPPIWWTICWRGKICPSPWCRMSPSGA